MAYESDPLTRRLNDLVNTQELYMGLMDFEELNPSEKALIGTWELANEVYNGGFMQYCHNSSGEHAGPMIEVLRMIGASRAAEIVNSAVALAAPIKCWPRGPVPADISDRLAELERQFYSELDAVHLHVFKFLSQHRDQIDAPADFWTEPASK